MKNQFKKLGVDSGLFMGGGFVFKRGVDGWQEAQTLEDLPAFGHDDGVVLENGESKDERVTSGLRFRLARLMGESSGFAKEVDRSREVFENKMRAIDQLGDLYEGAIQRIVGAEIEAVLGS